MASIGHVAVGLAAGRTYDQARAPSWRSLTLWSALSLLPDIDVAGFLRGVPYGAPWGHRGATHSLAMALAGGLAAGVAARFFKRPTARMTLFATMVLASHGMLDTMTDGGLGIALLWPFSLTRFFAPWRPIPVAPIGPAFFTPSGAFVASIELFLFLPLWLLAFRVRVRAAVIALWLLAVWLIASPDPVRERLLGLALRDDTRYAAGYSETAFRTISVGDSEESVRARLGEPLNESLFFLPKGSSFRSVMEMSLKELPPGCLGARLKGGFVDAALQEECRALGIVDGLQRPDVLRLLGAPSESCAEYTESPSRGHFRMRMVCFLHGQVEVVFRRWA